MNIVNTCHTAISNSFAISLPQRLTEVLERLQVREPNPTEGNFYIYDVIEQRTLSASGSTATMLGYAADATDEMNAIELGNLIHPDDLNSVSAHYQRFATLRSGDVIAISYRMKRADGSWCWLHSQETPVMMAIDGFPLQILGIVRLLPQLLAYSLKA